MIRLNYTKLKIKSNKKLEHSLKKYFMVTERNLKNLWAYSVIKMCPQNKDHINKDRTQCAKKFLNNNSLNADLLLKC